MKFNTISSVLALVLSLLFMGPAGCAKIVKSISTHNSPAVLASGKPLIVIMAGQSNMAGGYNEGRIVPDSPRIHYVGAAGSGPIQPFAENFVMKNPNINLIVVSCPVSGTYISQWAPGGLIEPCIAAAKKEISNGVMGGFIFFQGEADAKETGYTYDWAQAFTSLGRYVRSSLDPNMPIVVTRISKTTLPNFPLWDHVRQEQDAVSLPLLAHVSTDGATMIDGIHYDQLSYAMVGQRMADALYGLILED